MSWISFFGALELGLIYSLVAVSLYVSYRILNIADLSVDGTFPLGAVVATMLTTAGHPVIGLVCGLLAGMAAGFVTAALQTWLKVPSILAGIITMTALTSVNLMITGGVSNLPIAKNDETVFTLAQRLVGNRYAASLLVLGVLAAVFAAVLTVFFRT
ncbi:MAG: ABC transporter permease, partial [Oscillospiraceae bacterium]|nr:ABC transporter permease [Oscillospiraceae bacterium]